MRWPEKGPTSWKKGYGPCPCYLEIGTRAHKKTLCIGDRRKSGAPVPSRRLFDSFYVQMGLTPFTSRWVWRPR